MHSNLPRKVDHTTRRPRHHQGRRDEQQQRHALAAVRHRQRLLFAADATRTGRTTVARPHSLSPSRHKGTPDASRRHQQQQHPHRTPAAASSACPLVTNTPGIAIARVPITSQEGQPSRKRAPLVGEEATDGDWVTADLPHTAPQHTSIAAPAQDATARAAAADQSSAGGAATTSSACSAGAIQTPSRPRHPMTAVTRPEYFQMLSQNPCHQGGSAIDAATTKTACAPVTNTPGIAIAQVPSASQEGQPSRKGLHWNSPRMVDSATCRASGRVDAAAVDGEEVEGLLPTFYIMTVFFAKGCSANGRWGVWSGDHRAVKMVALYTYMTAQDKATAKEEGFVAAGALQWPQSHPTTRTSRPTTTRVRRLCEEGGGVSSASAAEREQEEEEEEKEEEEEDKTSEGAIEAGGPSSAGSPLEDAIGGASDSDEAAAANITTDSREEEGLLPTFYIMAVLFRIGCSAHGDCPVGLPFSKPHVEKLQVCESGDMLAAEIQADVAEKYKHEGVEFGPQNHKEHKTGIFQNGPSSRRPVTCVAIKWAKTERAWEKLQREIIYNWFLTHRAFSFKWRQEAIHRNIKEVWGVELPPYEPTDEVDGMLCGHSFSRKNKALGACGAATNTDSREEEAKEEQPMLDKDGDPIRLDFDAFAKHLTKKYELHVLPYPPPLPPPTPVAILKAIKEQWEVDYPPYQPKSEVEKMFLGHSFTVDGQEAEGLLPIFYIMAVLSSIRYRSAMTGETWSETQRHEQTTEVEHYTSVFSSGACGAATLATTPLFDREGEEEGGWCMLGEDDSTIAGMALTGPHQGKYCVWSGNDGAVKRVALYTTVTAQDKTTAKGTLTAYLAVEVGGCSAAGAVNLTPVDVAPVPPSVARKWRPVPHTFGGLGLERRK
ncbi:unnamed protein product [Vitrella brassicaformis CCMP3155]|uniref:Uncharacterized protein n=1 Tax=Vitrella brassicaformis (strain CCMP3155) TaxID=1169540 RepID=A0A0G4FES8_VITBC|nr:unnamed protein product [Vitrella brassicaformis CCMP3155]|eukprot:CEM11502.1 unnamed protein product [Vitrella brassicaformis CCMP3155]